MILPGQTVGILGGGQLGRFIGIEARYLSLKTIVLDPTAHSPAAQVCDAHIQAAIGDVNAALELAKRCDFITLEWELIPAAVLEAIERTGKPLFPSSKVIRPIQDRLSQKDFLNKHGFPQTVYAEVSNEKQLQAAVKKIGTPCLLKTRTHGYDGKGQYRIKSKADLAGAAQVLKSPCVLEAWVDYRREVSCLLALTPDGQAKPFPIAENVHRGGILHSTVALPGDPEKHPAFALAEKVGRALGHVGVMAVEMFETTDGKLLINEIAPRVHNSGHFTLGACATSQFAQHLRAGCGLPLGDTALQSPVVMINLLGDLWAQGEPRWQVLLERPDVRLFLYGKAKAAPGRKMGHFLLLGGDLAEAERLHGLLAPAVPVRS